MLILQLAVTVAANLRDRAYYEEKFFNWLSQHKVAAAVSVVGSFGRREKNHRLTHLQLRV
jgi:hypothetical protein